MAAGYLEQGRLPTQPPSTFTTAATIQGRIRYRRGTRGCRPRHRRRPVQRRRHSLPAVAENIDWIADVFGKVPALLVFIPFQRHNPRRSGRNHVFPNEPILQVSGNLIECQMVESLLLMSRKFSDARCDQSRAHLGSREPRHHHRVRIAPRPGTGRSFGRLPRSLHWRGRQYFECAGLRDAQYAGPRHPRAQLDSIIPIRTRGFPGICTILPG